MTQPPGFDPYGPRYGPPPGQGQQPGHGQPPQYGQHPQYGQPPQYGRQPDYGQHPQYGQQPTYGQQPGYDPPPGYGPPPAYGQPAYGPPPGFGPGYPAAPPPRKSRGWIVGLVLGGLALLLCCGGGTATVLALGGGAADSPTAAVEGYLQALEDHDTDGVHDLTCARRASDTPESFRRSVGSGAGVLRSFEWTVGPETNRTSVSADVRARIRFTFDVGGTTRTVPVTVTLGTVEERGWKVCDADLANP